MQGKGFLEIVAVRSGIRLRVSSISRDTRAAQHDWCLQCHLQQTPSGSLRNVSVTPSRAGVIDQPQTGAKTDTLLEVEGSGRRAPGQVNIRRPIPCCSCRCKQTGRFPESGGRCFRQLISSSLNISASGHRVSVGDAQRTVHVNPDLDGCRCI